METFALTMLPRSLRAIALWALLPAVCAVTASVLPKPLALYNPSPSIPTGYYLQSTALPGRGRLIAFHVPALGLAYAQAHIPYVVRGAIIKPVLATAGDPVCARYSLVANGQVVAPIARVNRQGRALPHWRDWRTLLQDEYFVFSNRMPNSFDSR